MITDADGGRPLAGPAPWLAASLSLGDAAALVLAAAVPRFATAAAMFCREDVLTGGRPDRPAGDAPLTVRRIATGLARDGRAAPDPAFPAGEVLVFAADSPYATCVRDGRPRTFGPPTGPALPQARHRPDAHRARSGYGSSLAVPIAVGQQVTGFLVFAREPARPPFRDSDAGQFTGLAERVARCVLTACRVPSSPPPPRPRRPALAGAPTTMPGTAAPAPATAAAGTVVIEAGDVEVAGHCRAAPGQAVGGDWYDVLTLSGGRIGLIIGDAMGHDQSAAAAMMQLRAAAHALAELDLPPAEVLRRLDRTTAALGVVTLATCVYAIIDPGHRSCLVAGAGHLPPVLVHPDGTTAVPELPSGLPLGLGAAIYGQISLPLPPGAALALYTDGLVDTRTRSSQQGIEALRAELAGRPGLTSACADRTGNGTGSLRGCCDQLVGALAPQPEDDTTLVLARIRPRPATAPPPVPL
jgi:hypothetical protein